MSANDILGYAFTTLSFFSVIYALFGNKTGIFACVLVIFALLSFLFVILYLKVSQNKTYTLQILSKENRSLALRLLLTYEHLKCSKDVFSDKFVTPKFYISNAHYTYEIMPPCGSSTNLNLKCKFIFQIEKAPNNSVFDILIAQPRGKPLKTINYKFSDKGKEHTTSVKKISISRNKTNFSGFLKAQISTEGYEGIQTLIVSYTLEEVYRASNAYGAFLLCPFVYAKKIKQFDVQVIYPKDSEHYPHAVCLKLYPYDGRRYRPRKVVDFSSTDDHSLWTTNPLHCVTNAIYIIETHGNIK